MPATDRDDIERRLAAVERAVTDDNAIDSELNDTGAATDNLAEIEDRLSTLEDRVEELDAAVQAVRGYAGNVRAVNRDVERRAEAAIAAVDRIEAQLDGVDVSDELSGNRRGPDDGTTGRDSDRIRHGDTDCDRAEDGASSDGDRRADAGGNPGPGGAVGTATARSTRGAGDASDSSPSAEPLSTARAGDGDEGADDPLADVLDEHPAEFGPDGTDSTDRTDAEGRTEAFVERVRDALS